MIVAESEVKEAAAQPAGFHHILVATDFSKCSERALVQAVSLAEENDSDVSLVHVLTSDWRYEMLENPPELGLEFIDAKQKLDASAREASRRKIESTVIRRGPIAGSVVGLAQQQGADLIVVGTRGRSGLSKVVLGSVAEEVLSSATCPVMTVGPQARLGAECTESHAILFATDFGKGSAKASIAAVGLAQRRRAKLVLLHMMTPMPVNSTNLSAYAPAAAAAEDVQEWERASRMRCLEQLKAYLPSGIHLVQEPEYIVGMELCAEGILTAAEKFRAGLIVMGVNKIGSAKVRAHLPWTAVHEVVRNASCPVLTVAG